MIGETWRALATTWGGYLSGARHLLPHAVCMLTVVAVGWLVASGSRQLLRRSLRGASLAAARHGRLAQLLLQADLPSADRLIAEAVYWVVWLVSLLAGFDCFGLDSLGTLRAYGAVLVPRLAVALGILLLGTVLANFVAPMAVLATVNSGWRLCGVVNAAVRTLVLATAAAMAVDHLGVARSVLLVGFTITYGSIMLALALSIGIGASGAVGRLIEERLTPPLPGMDSSGHL